ncbi:hypothetical protein Tdes44962_MAKER07769 [Teratosphaeria destructans]|uniref:Uncharacterized protein n=1 Tax=Teratosphaeria destructans TaxID=418781 RepID=A0A9W7W5T3_9PEZI|nr:hypothetical protein Tdes44962_MAKER07769 [Teratosphaeria destructans]
MPRSAQTYDLAFFLRTTGPPAPHRRPSKLGSQARSPTGPKKKALRLFGIGKRTTTPVVAAHDRLNNVLHDEGGLLQDLPNGVEQRQTSSGQKYLALQVPNAPLPQVKEEQDKENIGPSQLNDVYESQVSVSFADDLHSSDVLDNWLMTLSKEHSRRSSPTPPRKSSAHLPLGEALSVRCVPDSSPIRPAASNPPTPTPPSAVSMSGTEFTDFTPKRSIDTCRALSSHPVRFDSSSTILPKIALPHEEFPVKLPTAEKEVEIRHPAPRRLASHPVLLHRASSIASTLYPRSFSESPGPPPPRSPLRLRRDPRTIEDVIANHESARKASPKFAPSILPVDEYNEQLPTILPSITTECSGPISKNRKKPISHPAYRASRKAREERTRTRKLRDRPYTARTIDSVVNPTPPLPPPGRMSHRLRKARPNIKVRVPEIGPDLCPKPLVTRQSSSASSIASWKKVTENTRTPVSPVPSEEDLAGENDKTGYTPVSPTTSQGSSSAHTSIAMSPRMLVAEEVPVPRAKSQAKAARVIVKEGKGYAPRPRSASIPRNALKRRSRTNPTTPSVRTSPRSGSPIMVGALQDDEPPPLPSQPPNRALPPTPPASGSEKPNARSRYAVHKKELPMLPTYEIAPKENTPPKRKDVVQHVANQAQRRSLAIKDAGKKSSLESRLEALEKQNNMLSAALMAVLRTNGNFNGPLPIMAEPESPLPMAWETRLARRSAASHAASHAASSSNGSALEMYMSTRRGSQKGR